VTFISPTADIDAVTYHEWVCAEARGEADDGMVARLEEDPFRWAAHLGMVIGDICDQLDAAGPDADPEWLTAAKWARRGYVAKKGDVVALRKREILHFQCTKLNVRCQALTTAMQQMRDLIESSLPDDEACDAILDLVNTALARDPIAVPDRMAS
jgi:hypothetical protein